MDALTPSDPSRLGRYWPSGRLGAGGQGVVYEAYDEAGGRVAIKVPRVDDPVSRSRLAREAEAAQRVASFCTARVIEVRTDVAQPYIVSEYVPGPTLRRVIGENGPLGDDALRRLAIGAATALAAIHQAGVVHRDFKPDNIILSPDGPRVIDFGVARQAGPTTTGPIMGTPAYTAPEVLTGGRATAAADIWAWGLVVLFAASGHDAVQAGEPAALTTAVLDFRPDPGGLAPPLASLVTRALARDPADRPSAMDLLPALLGVFDGDRLLAEGGETAALLTGEGDAGLGAIAEELFEELSEDERAIAPDVFLRMTGDDDTVRRVSRAEFAGLDAVDSLLALYGAAGLIVEADSSYTLAGPALVRAWPRLRRWVADNREGLPIHRRLTEAARLWDEHGRMPGDLPHGSNLDRTLRWAAAERRDIVLLDLERAFLDAAVARTRRRSRHRGLLAATLAVLLVAALAGLGLAEYRRGVSERQRDAATARSLALRAADLRQSDPALAMLLSVAAWRLDPSLPESRGALYEAMSQPLVDSFTDPESGPDTAYALSRDGGALAAVREGRVRLWDVRAHRRIGSFTGVSRTVRKAALSPDGRTLALQDDRGVQLWDVTTGRPAGAGFAAGVEEFQPGEMVFDRTGRLLAVPEGGYAARWWDVAGRRRLRAGSGAGLDAVNADRGLGVVTSTGGGRAELWDLREGRRVRAPWLPLKGEIEEAEFSEDGRTLAFVAAAGGERHLLMRRVPSGAPVADYTGGDTGRRAAFGTRLLAHWSLLGELVVHRVSDGRIVAERKLPGSPETLRVDEAHRVLRVLTDGGRIFTLDVSPLFDEPLVEGAQDASALLGPGGRILAVGTRHDTRLWDTRTARPIGVPVAGRANVLAFSRDGRRVAVAETAGRRVRIADTGSGRVLSAFDVSGRRATGVDDVAFAPDGATLAVTPFGVDGILPLELHDLGTGSRVLTGVPGGGAAFRPDGGLLVAGSVPELLDPASGARRARPEGLGSLSRPYAFRPDGGLAAFTAPGRIVLWNSGLTSAVGELPSAGEGAFLTWSPDGRTLASYESGDRVRLWDVPSGRLLGVVFDGLTAYGFGGRASLAFDADGRTLYSATPEGMVRRHPLDGDRVAAAVCARTGRTLTTPGWRRHLPQDGRFEVCGEAAPVHATAPVYATAPV